jgi:hypothetical protein
MTFSVRLPGVTDGGERGGAAELEGHLDRRIGEDLAGAADHLNENVR